MRSAASDPSQALFTFDPEIIPRGDGTYLVKPGKPQPVRKKLTIAEAAEFSRLSEDTVMRLYDSGLIEGERPTVRKTFIYQDSLDAHIKATRDREFWEKKNRKQLYLDAI